tara:strand:+ start:376 stop:597 length:222 start_codon:yes stop_codon:yes gene_type:complete
MPSPDFCLECDKPSKILDWRYLCNECAEKEDEYEFEKEMYICKNGNKETSIKGKKNNFKIIGENNKRQKKETE